MNSRWLREWIAASLDFLLLMRVRLSLFENHSPACMRRVRALIFFLLGVQSLCMQVHTNFYIYGGYKIDERLTFVVYARSMKSSLGGVHFVTVAATCAPIAPQHALENVIHFPFSPHVLKRGRRAFSVPASAFSVRSQGVFIFPRRDVSLTCKTAFAPGRRDMHIACSALPYKVLFHQPQPHSSAQRKGQVN